MQTQSKKAKGRNLQKWVRDMVLELFPSLTEHDVRSTSMGASGEDVQLSTKARELLPLSFECKSRARWAFYTDLEQAEKNAPQGTIPVLIAKGNYKKPVAILDAEQFLRRYAND